MKFSVIVPAYNSEDTLADLLHSLYSQRFKDFEVIVVDDCSRDNTPHIVESFPYRLIRMPKNKGPACCRNIGADHAQGEILVFTDSDCVVAPDWIEAIHSTFSQQDVAAIMGRVILSPSSIQGDSISALGFPAGGAIGFEKIWRVDSGGFTDSLSSCNCAVNKVVFDEIGGFDASFPYAGGEDSLFAYHLTRFNYQIKYCPNVVVCHKARDSLKGFLTWQFRRGVSSFIFSTKIADKKQFAKLRLWSTGNILRHYFWDRKFPFILFLLGTSFAIQFVGFMYGKYKRDVLR